MNNQQRKELQMGGCAENKAQTVDAKDVARTAHVGERGVKFLGMKHLKLVQVKIGKEGKTISRFSPSIGGVPKEFLILPEIEWRDADDEAISGALRRYVASLGEKGESVELSVADTGVVRIDLTLDGECRSLWFNARTSDTVVLDADGNGKWSTGNYHRHTLPETIIDYINVLDLKAGWDIDLSDPWEL
jgi:hypothetical protein